MTRKASVQLLMVSVRISLQERAEASSPFHPPLLHYSNMWSSQHTKQDISGDNLWWRLLLSHVRMTGAGLRDHCRLGNHAGLLCHKHLRYARSSWSVGVIRRKVVEDSASVYVQICCVQLSVNVEVMWLQLSVKLYVRKGIVVIGTESSINFLDRKS